MNSVKKVGLFVSASILALSLGGTSSAVAAPAGQKDLAKDQIIVPYVNWSGSAYLSKNNYTNITSSNNVFNDSPKVTNGADSPGSVTVRIVNGKGEVVGSAQTIQAGSSVRLDQIPWNSGTYTLQGKGSVAGTYYISID